MKRHRRIDSAIVVFVAAAVVLSAGCAATREPWGNPSSGLLLSYRFEGDGARHYRRTVATEQTMRTLGRERGVSASRTVDFRIVSGGSADGTLSLDVTVEGLVYALDTPRGKIEREAPEAHDRRFVMTLSPLGTAIDLGDAESIEYSMPPVGMQKLADEFRDLLPELPDRPLRVGDTWTATRSVDDPRFRGTMEVSTHLVNKLEGYETIDGVPCAKITTQITGRMTGLTEGPVGSDSSSGAVSGSATWYFDYRGGVLVRYNASLRQQGRAAAHSATGPPSTVIEQTTVDIDLVR